MNGKYIKCYPSGLLTKSNSPHAHFQNAWIYSEYWAKDFALVSGKNGQILL